MNTTVELRRGMFDAMPHPPLIRAGDRNVLQAALFRYSTGIEAVSLSNHHGHVTVLPFLGGIVWEAIFEGVSLGMQSRFGEPLPATDIRETYGGLFYHAGVQCMRSHSGDARHPYHGEAPVAQMERAYLHLERDERGSYLRYSGFRSERRAFGYYLTSTPSVTLYADSSIFEICMMVANLSERPIDLTYMAHANFAFVADGILIQPAPFSPKHVQVRTEVPDHIDPTPGYAERLRKFASNPEQTRMLDPKAYKPEQVFYLSGLREDEAGWTNLGLRRPGPGDGFGLSYRQQDFPFLTRWILNDTFEKVCAFALPATHNRAGYTAEPSAEALRLDPRRTLRFPVRLGYLDPLAMAELERRTALP
jgi:hypothetical protein